MTGKLARGYLTQRPYHTVAVDADKSPTTKARWRGGIALVISVSLYGSMFLHLRHHAQHIAAENLVDVNFGVTAL